LLRNNPTMHLLIEFPMHVVASYHGPGNLDVALDDNISYLIGKYCHDHQIPFTIHSIDFVPAQPQLSDELVRYKVEMGMKKQEFKPEQIFEDLEKEGYERGLTIRELDGQILFADKATGDLPLRRQMMEERKRKKRKRK